jgi:hypothetical protein
MRPWLARFFSAVIAVCLGATMSSVLAPTAHACSCGSPRSAPERSVDPATAIFTGTVLLIDRSGHERPPDRGVRARFAVSEAVRNVTERRVHVWTNEEGPACGYKFQVGATYRVHASRGEHGQLTTSSCHTIELLPPSHYGPIQRASHMELFIDRAERWQWHITGIVGGSLAILGAAAFRWRVVARRSN